jgi:hypothetical protein
MACSGVSLGWGERFSFGVAVGVQKRIVEHDSIASLFTIQETSQLVPLGRESNSNSSQKDGVWLISLYLLFFLGMRIRVLA